MLSHGLKASARCPFERRSAPSTSANPQPILSCRRSRRRERGASDLDADDPRARRRRRRRPPLRALFDGSEGGLARAAEDLLRALRAEPESDGSGGRSGSGAFEGDDDVDDVDGRGPAARRADELERDGMWPLYEALGSFAALLDLAEVEGEDGGDASSTESVDAEALSLLRSHPSLLLVPRSELAKRMVLLKRSLGPGADAAALARRLPWLLRHPDPGDVVRPALRQMARLMPGVSGGGGGGGSVGGSTEALLAARLFGGGRGGSDGGERRRPRIAGRASQGWLTFADIARSLDRKLKVEERERREREAGGGEGG